MNTIEKPLAKLTEEIANIKNEARYITTEPLQIKRTKIIIMINSIEINWIA